MMDIWKDLPETETNHDISHFMGRGGAYSKQAWQLSTTPDSQWRIPIHNGVFVPQMMAPYSTGRRHDACI